jgi:hypothetical protein
MSVSFERTTYSGRQQAFWRGEAKMLPNGYQLENAIAAGTVLLRGAFVHIDTDKQTGAVVKFAKVLKGGTTAAPRIEKGSYIQAGDTMQVIGGTASQVVVSVDTSNAEYDVVTLKAALTGATEGAFIIESDGASESPAPKYLPNAVLGADREVKKNDMVALDVAYDVVVLKNVVPSFPTDWLADGGLVLKTNPNIMFIHS